METINRLNKLMNDFYKAWEFESTEEQFISLNAELETTTELESNIKKFQSMTDEIESLINDENNFEAIVEQWDAIDQPMLDILVSTFEIEIQDFLERLNKEEVRKEVIDFFNARR